MCWTRSAIPARSAHPSPTRLGRVRKSGAYFARSRYPLSAHLSTAAQTAESLKVTEGPIPDSCSAASLDYLIGAAKD